LTHHDNHRSISSGRYLNAVLTAIACLLLLNLMAGSGVLPRSASALAQDDDPRPSALPFNSGEQRNRMNAALDSIDARLAHIEAKLEKGLSVKVTEMPPVKLVEDKNKDDRRRDNKPAPQVDVRPAPAEPAADPKKPGGGG